MEKIKKFLFVNTSTKQTVIKNTFWLFVSEASGRLLKIGLIVYAARVLGANGWGVFSYAMSIGSLMMIFSDIGIGNLLTREIIKKNQDYKSFASSASFIKIVISFISAILILFISPYLSNIKGANILFPMIAITLFFGSITDLCLSINRASEKMEKEMIVKFIMNTSIIVLGILLLIIKPEPESIAIAYAIGSIIGFIIILLIIKNDIKKIFSKINIKTIMIVLKTSIPFAIIGLIANIMSNTDIYMLGIWKNATEIGLYSSVQRIQQFTLIIPSMIATAIFPIMSKLANNDNDKFKTITEQSISIVFLIGIPIALGGMILADQIIPLIFGLGYINAIPILQILILILIFSFPFTLLSNAIFAYNKQKSLILVYLLGMIINIILNILLIPKFGAIGASLSVLISTALITVVTWIKMKKINYFEVLSKLKKIILSTIIMIIIIIILKFLNVNILINIIISSLVYLGIL
jgi:O-antigen/teichoic acid export membrane protein